MNVFSSRYIIRHFWSPISYRSIHIPNKLMLYSIVKIANQVCRYLFGVLNTCIGIEYFIFGISKLPRIRLRLGSTISKFCMCICVVSNEICYVY